MARNYNNGRLVTVTIAGFSNLRYGFKTRVRDSTSTDLGHTSIDPVNISDIRGIVIGANSPKPPRASKRTEQGIESSYIDKDRISQARQNGYQISRGRIRRSSNTRFATTKYIEINGVKYAWAAPDSQSEPTSLGQAGLQEASTDDNLVFGAKFPKPPRMAIEVNDGVYSTFVDPRRIDDLAQAGWVPADNGLYTTADFKQLA